MVWTRVQDLGIWELGTRTLDILSRALELGTLGPGPWFSCPGPWDFGPWDQNLGFRFQYLETIGDYQGTKDRKQELPLCPTLGF